MKRLAGILIIICLLIGLFILEQSKPGIPVKAAAVESTDTIAYKPFVNKDLKIVTKDFYRLFREDTAKTMTISITESEWQGILQDMAIYARMDDRMRTGNYRRADLTYEDKDGRVTIEGIGIRTKGNTTRILPWDNLGYHRANLKLKFDETFDLTSGSKEYKELSGRSFMGLDGLILKANMSDQSFIHEKFAYDLLAKSGAMAPQISLVNVKIKIGGKLVNYGVYSMIEPIDSEFLKKRYKDPTGNLYKCLWQNYGPATLEPVIDKEAIGIKDWTKNYRPAYDLKTNKNKPDHTVLIDFIDKLNALTGDELKTYLDTNFEVDHFLRFLACNMLLGMPDDYWAMGNNYYLYFNPAGKIEFIPYDYDQCLGSGWDGNNPQSYVGLATANILKWQNTAQILTGQPSARPLIDKVLSVDEYKNRYLSYLKNFINPVNNRFSYPVFKGTYEFFSKLYGPYMLNDTVESSSMALTSEEWFMTTKTKNIKDQLSSINN